MVSNVVHMPTGIKPFDAGIEYLPDEGESLLFSTATRANIEGYFLWSGEYVFLETVDDDFEEVTGVVSWEYTNKDYFYEVGGKIKKEEL